MLIELVTSRLPRVPEGLDHSMFFSRFLQYHILTLVYDQSVPVCGGREARPAGLAEGVRGAYRREPCRGKPAVVPTVVPSSPISVSPDRSYRILRLSATEILFGGIIHVGRV